MVLAVLPIAVAVAGCGGEIAVSDKWAGSVDTVAGILVINNPAQPIWEPETSWRLEQDLSIGAVEGDPDYEFSVVADLEVDDGGRIYVLDADLRRISIYDSAGSFITAFGRRGEGPGEFEAPISLHWGADTLVVWDRGQRRLSYFDRQARLLRDALAGLPFSAGRLELRRDGRAWAQPAGIVSADERLMPGRNDGWRPGYIADVAVAPSGEIYAVDQVLRRVWKLSTNLTVKRYWGRRGDGPGEFQSPVAVAVDPQDGTVLVAENSPPRIHRFRPDGSLVQSAPLKTSVEKITVDSDYHIVVASPAPYEMIRRLRRDWPFLWRYSKLLQPVDSFFLVAADDLGKGPLLARPTSIGLSSSVEDRSVAVLFPFMNVIDFYRGTKRVRRIEGCIPPQIKTLYEQQLEDKPNKPQAAAILATAILVSGGQIYVLSPLPTPDGTYHIDVYDLEGHPQKALIFPSETLLLPSFAVFAGVPSLILVYNNGGLMARLELEGI